MLRDTEKRTAKKKRRSSAASSSAARPQPDDVRGSWSDVARSQPAATRTDPEQRAANPRGSCAKTAAHEWARQHGAPSRGEVFREDYEKVGEQVFECVVTHLPTGRTARGGRSKGKRSTKDTAWRKMLADMTGSSQNSPACSRPQGPLGAPGYS